jgi:hypothetical protein
MEDTGFDLLFEGLPPKEAKMIRKLLTEWSDGDEDSFLVQFALLTRAQWRMAASVPRSVNDSRKWLEQHLAEYRRQTAGLVEEFGDTVTNKNHELKAVVEAHTKTVQATVSGLRRQLAEAQIVGREFQREVKSCISDWKQARINFQQERKDLEAICQAMAERMAWWNVRGLLWIGVIAFSAGLLIGYFAWKS